MDFMKDELDILLNDICEYLKIQETNSALPSEDRKKAQFLIERSKKQLGKISRLKYNFSKDEPNTVRYVTMTSQPTIKDKPPPLPSPNPVNPSSNTVFESVQKKCPHKDLSAESFLKMKTGSKHGELSLRKKFSFASWLTCPTKIFGAIHENWLLIYSSKISNKPFRIIDLKEYEAKEDVCESNMIEPANSKEEKSKNNGTMKGSSFRVTNLSSPNKREYHFVASTYKDMLQWVVNINRSHDRTGKAFDDDNYDPIVITTTYNDEEDIYDNVDVQNSSNYPQRRVPSPPISRSSSSPMLYDEIGNVENTTSDDVEMEDFDACYDVIAIRKNDSEKGKLPEETFEESTYENDINNISQRTTSIGKNSIKTILEEVKINKLISNVSTLHSRLSPICPNHMSEVQIKIKQNVVSSINTSSTNLGTFPPNSKLDAIKPAEAVVHILPPTTTMLSESFKRLKSVCRESQENIEKTTETPNPTKVAKKLQF